jgi:hypothetical protein
VIDVGGNISTVNATGSDEQPEIDRSVTVNE